MLRGRNLNIPPNPEPAMEVQLKLKTDALIIEFVETGQHTSNRKAGTIYMGSFGDSFAYARPNSRVPTDMSSDGGETWTEFFWEQTQPFHYDDVLIPI